MIQDEILNSRLKLKLTRKQVAKSSGICFKIYSKIENGQFRKLSKTDYEKLKDVLELSKLFERLYVSPYINLTHFKDYREKIGCSMSELSRKTGIPVDRICNLENGHQKTLTFEDFEKLSKIFHISNNGNYDHLIIGRSSVKFKFINDGSLGELVKEKREKLELTRSELSRMAEIDSSLLAKIENYNKSVSIQTFLKLANALELSEKEKSRYLIKK